MKVRPDIRIISNLDFLDRIFFVLSENLNLHISESQRYERDSLYHIYINHMKNLSSQKYELNIEMKIYERFLSP